MTTQQLQAEIIDRCKKARACEGQFKSLFAAKNPGEFVRILMFNYGWCYDEKIFTVDEILQFDPAELKKIGLLTQDNHPIDFTPQEIGGVIWEPFNVGASLENPIGDYLNFDQATDPERGLRVPTSYDHWSLANTGNSWAIYQGIFGRLFDKRLFIPAAGYEDYDVNGKLNGKIRGVGRNGYSWSSSVSSSNGYYLYFSQGSLNPSDASGRASGFQVRCLRE